MSDPSNAELELQDYFRRRARHLLTEAELVIADHNGLRGSHREAIWRSYLKQILPKRFKVGYGMIYDALYHRSQEADVVLWDAHNYPRLPASGHSVFFAESVRTVLEVKSVWSADELKDIQEKYRSIAALSPTPYPTAHDYFAYLLESLRTSQSGQPVVKYQLPPQKIGMAALILRGGEQYDPKDILQQEIEDMENNWPDILLFLAAGKVIVKRNKPSFEEESIVFRRYNGQYPPDKVHLKYLEFINAGEDALLIFTAALLDLLREQTVQAEAPFYLGGYVNQMLGPSEVERLWPHYVIEFPDPFPRQGRPWFPEELMETMVQNARQKA